MGLAFIACNRLHIPNERGITMIKYEYEVAKSNDVRRELLMYENSLQKKLESAQARVTAIAMMIQRAKERRLELEIQSIN